MIDKDYSFIRLRNDFNEAKNLGESPEVNIFYHGQVHLCTNETYLQRTNVSGGISFQADYVVSVVNCANDVLQDITDKVFISEFSDYTGTQQIDFEIKNIGVDFGMDDVYLRFESGSNSEYVFFSNPIRITDFDAQFTSYFQYKHTSNWRGTEYVAVSRYQGIRLATYFVQNRNANEVDHYRQMTTGNTVITRFLFNEFEEYRLQMWDGWSLKRLRINLSCESVYIDGIRCYKQGAIEDSDRIEASNTMSTILTIGKDLEDTKEVESQIAPPDSVRVFNTIFNSVFA